MLCCIFQSYNVGSKTGLTLGYLLDVNSIFGKNYTVISVQEENWTEMARRLFCLASVGTVIRASQQLSFSGGLDIALGDYVGSSPVGVLGPSVVLQGLLAGSVTETPLNTPAELPMVPP